MFLVVPKVDESNEETRKKRCRDGNGHVRQKGFKFILSERKRSLSFIIYVLKRVFVPNRLFSLLLSVPFPFLSSKKIPRFGVQLLSVKLERYKKQNKQGRQNKRSRDGGGEKGRIWSGKGAKLLRAHGLLRKSPGISQSLLSSPSGRQKMGKR